MCGVEMLHLHLRCGDVASPRSVSGLAGWLAVQSSDTRWVHGSAINCVTLAMIDAGLPLRDFVTACDVGYIDGHVLVDLNDLESSGTLQNPPAPPPRQARKPFAASHFSCLSLLPVSLSFSVCLCSWSVSQRCGVEESGSRSRGVRCVWACGTRVGVCGSHRRAARAHSVTVALIHNFPPRAAQQNNLCM